MRLKSNEMPSIYASHHQCHLSPLLPSTLLSLPFSPPSPLLLAVFACGYGGKHILDKLIFIFSRSLYGSGLGTWLDRSSHKFLLFGKEILILADIGQCFWKARSRVMYWFLTDIIGAYRLKTRYGFE